MKGILGLKIDVDTYRGMKSGVPRLLSLLNKNDLRGTFFLSIGPDSSGRAVLQILKNPLFLKKMIRTKATSLYGFKTAFYGTLIPSPKIALSFPDHVREIMSQGHEIQFHAWDHRRWQDEMMMHNELWLKEWFKKGFEGFEKLTGRKPTSFGAPAWLIDERVISIVSGLCLDYLSCTRAKEPFIHKDADLIEIPSDLPCYEEMDNIEHYERVIIEALDRGGIHVLPVHAEVEGGPLSEHFIRLIESIKNLGYRILPLNEILMSIDKDSLAVRQFQIKLLPGRSVPCAV